MEQLNQNENSVSKSEKLVTPSGREYTPFDIETYEKLKVGDIVTVVKDGEVLDLPIIEKNNINSIVLKNEQGNAHYKYGIHTEVPFDEIRGIHNEH